jgi:hypothetical protein
MTEGLSVTEPGAHRRGSVIADFSLLDRESKDPVAALQESVATSLIARSFEVGR